MKTKILWLVLILSIGCISFADSRIERKIVPRRSAIQSTNVVFSNSSYSNNYASYSSAIKEIEAKIDANPQDFTLNVSLIALYIKSRQFEKANYELLFLNKLVKKNVLKDNVLQQVANLKKYVENIVRYNKNSNLYANLSIINLILQDIESAENALLKSINGSLFITNFKEVFNTTGNYQLAIEMANKVLLKNPSSYDLRKLKAEYLMQLNRKDEAIKELTKLVSYKDNDLDVKYNLYLLLTEQNVKEKELLSKLYPNSNRDYENAYVELSNILFEHDDFQGAQKFAQKLIDNYPDNANGYIILSELYRSQGKLKESYDVLKLVRDRANDSDSIAKYNVLLAKLSDEPVKEADSLMNNGLYSQALEVLKVANQENLYVILGQARANYFVKNKQASFDLLNKAMSLYPNNPDVFYYFAYILYKEGDLESARNYINQTLNINPKHSFALKLLDVLNKAESDKYYAQIMESFEAQNYDETMRLINEALEINKKDSGLYYYQGLTYIAMNNYAVATAPLYKALELDKNNIPAYFYLGLAFDNLSEPDNALSYYKKFINLIPNDDYGESEKIEYAKSRIAKLSR